jgi:class 3 adenylate cyclase
LHLRISIHSGNIIIRYSEILGDGVDIARLIEGVGLPGGIYLSENAYKEVKNRKDVRVNFLTEKILPKIPNPLKIYTIPTERMKKRLFKEKSLESDAIA